MSKPDIYYLVFYDDPKDLTEIDGVFKTVINDDTVDETMFFVETADGPEHTHFKSIEDWIEDCAGIDCIILSEEEFFLLAI